ncbi:nitrate/nitrite transporter NrtS [uncultured Ruegeria sp.]|uniref:nitrate/nitrite transporter NrtS n=1 Tax=uncultured Ruegeria sp. TaxID=259304 RepID=UPI0026103A65|nr:nitrate/nitrite transporter NrtS [uncultured Ruegeria sp.]
MMSVLYLASRKDVRRRAATIAVIVGPIIALINHGDALFAGVMTVTQWGKIALTFAVPYSVSTVSSVLAIKEREND